MRNIQFQEVGMENYGPYISPMILQFDNDKLNLIVGRNGIGKTMSLEAVPFTLYGVTSKGASASDVINNKTNKNCKTWVKFKINDDNYIVTRYAKYSKFGNTVIINHNGIDIKQGQKECLPLIEKLICPQKAFMNAFMFGQKVKDFFTDLPDSQKKDIFRKVLNLEIFLKYYELASDKVKEGKAESEGIKNEIEIKKSLLNNSDQQLNLLYKSKNEFYENLKNKIIDKKSSIDESNRLLTQWKLKQEELKSNDVDLQSITSNLSLVEKQLNDIAGDYSKRINDVQIQKKNKIGTLDAQAKDKIIDIKNTYSGKLAELNKQELILTNTLNCDVNDLKDTFREIASEQSKVKFTIGSLQDKIDEIKDHVLNCNISECPTCKQEVTEKTIELLKNKIFGYDNEILINTNKFNQFNKELQKIKDQIKEKESIAKTELESIKSGIREIKQNEALEIEEIKNKLSAAISKINKMVTEEISNINNEKVEKTQEYTSKIEELNKTKRQIENTLDQIKSVDEKIRGIEYDIKNFNKEIKDLENTEHDDSQINFHLNKQIEYKTDIDVLNNSHKENELLQDISLFWKSAFSSSGIPSMLIDESIPFMNERVEYYLEMLTNGRYIVSFDTLSETKSGEFRDKISVNVLDSETLANSRIQLSGGQTRIIDIAIILTMGDLLSKIQNISFNILLFDEIFDALDEQNIQYVSKVLSKIKVGKSIYLISHHNQDYLETDEIFKFS